MKKLAAIALLLLISPLLVTSCYAEGLYDQLGEAAGVYTVEDGLRQEEKEILGDLRLDGSYDSEGALRRLWESMIRKAKTAAGDELGRITALLALAMGSALACILTEKKNYSAIAEIAACAAAANELIRNVDGVFSQCREAILRLSDYSKAAIPVLFTAAGAGGAVVSAPARYAAACLALDVLLSAAQNGILPMIHLFVAVSIARCLFDNAVLRAAAQFMKWAILTSMTFLTILFSAYIGITGVVSGSADALAVKTARTVISSALPVVGGILSDSAGVLLSAAAVIKNTAGLFSLIAVSVLCAGPLVLLLIKYLLYRMVSTVVEMLPGSRLPGLIGDVGTSFGLLLGLIGCCAIMLFVSIMSGIRMVSGS